MIPEKLPELEDDWCSFSERWVLLLDLVLLLVKLRARVPWPIQIISGFRTAQKQAELITDGIGAADHLSTHRSCPATGVDLWLPTVTATDAVKAQFGAAVVSVGLRWGGGSPVSSSGIPQDWNHVDMGPRR